MSKPIGISLKIRQEWIDATLARVVETTNVAALRAQLDELLTPELPGTQVRAKTAGILMRIWATIPADRLALRERAVKLLPQLPGDDQLWLHWGMAALAYPFFRDTAEVVGRLLALQDDFTTQQVQGRLATAWGDRLTSRKSARYLLNTLVNWGVLQATRAKGHFGPGRKKTTRSPELQLWLAEALIAAANVEEIEVQQLLRLPESFPFSFSLGLSDLRRHDRFNIHRQGVDVDLVALRPTRRETREEQGRRQQGGDGIPQQAELFDHDPGASR